MSCELQNLLVVIDNQITDFKNSTNRRECFMTSCELYKNLQILEKKYNHKEIIENTIMPSLEKCMNDKGVYLYEIKEYLDSRNGK